MGKEDLYKIGIIYENISFNNDEISKMASEFQTDLKSLKTIFPWTDSFLIGKDLMSNFYYISSEDTLTYSIALIDDDMDKKKVMNIIKTVFPRIKNGMDFKDFVANTENLSNKKYISGVIGDDLNSYDVSLENVQTGYWDLVLTILNASKESPNKVMKACEVFNNAAEYLNGEFYN